MAHWLIWASVVITFIVILSKPEIDIVYISTKSWRLITYSFQFFMNFLIFVGILSFSLSMCMCIQTMIKEIRLFRNQRMQALQDDAEWVETASEVPGQSGDHLEFFDIPEFLDGEQMPNIETRRRRQRMVSTLLRDISRNSSRARSRNAIEESLRESEDFEFLTPLPSPRKSTSEMSGQNNNYIVTNKSSQTMPTDETSPGNLTNSISSPEASHKTQEQKLILHQYPRGITKPSLSCYAMFVETYIRLIEIACDLSMDCVEPNGPWLECGDKKIFGWKDCIKYIKTNYTDATSLFSVSGTRDGSSWSLTLLVDHLIKGLECWRWVVEDASEFIRYQPGWNRICKDNPEEATQLMKTISWHEGFGKMSYPEVTDAIFKDLESLSQILGEKLFLLGNTPTEVDCYAFSVLCQIEWGEESVLRDRIREFLNVQNYCVRLRSLLWADWDDQLAIVDSSSPEYSSENAQDEQAVSCNRKPSKTDFTKAFYQLLPPDETISDSEVDGILSTFSGPIQDDLLYISTRYTTKEILMVTKQRHDRADEENIVQLVRDGEIIHSCGLEEEYFDDNFEDMERISFSSNSRPTRNLPEKRLA